MAIGLVSMVAQILFSDILIKWDWMPYSAAGQICKFASLPEHCLNLAPQHYSSIAGYPHLAEMLTKLRARWGHWLSPEDGQGHWLGCLCGYLCEQECDLGSLVVVGVAPFSVSI